jgi:GH24 family phage-related lysozyme (muramidase)
MPSVFRPIKAPKHVAGFFTVIITSIGIGAPMTLDAEGMELKPYYDSVGIKTVCGGETEFVEDRVYSEQECTDMFAVRYGYFSFAVAQYYNETARAVVTPEIHAAFTDTAYNVGIPTVQKSSMIRFINEGKPVQACEAIKLYTKAGGKDCRIRSNNCHGVWQRRLKIYDLCMKGVKSNA